MTTAEKCEVILKEMLERVNREEQVHLERYRGKNSLTIHVDASKVDCGWSNEIWSLCKETTWEELVDELFNKMTHSDGMGWHWEAVPQWK